MLEPRPSQQKVLAYKQGKMGVSAVPGSGKTFTLARLAADLVTERIQEDQEVLVVTLVNSAVDNVSARIDRMLMERNLLPRLGYRVRTLHGLAHDIVRERPGLVGLAEDFQIIDERSAESILDDCCESWLKVHHAVLEEYLKADLEDGTLQSVKRRHLPELVRGMMSEFVRQAKDRQISPEVLWSRLVGREGELPLAHMGATVYANYQQMLNYRGGVDFDDLIRYALDALRIDPDYLQRLRSRWVYVLEDEAQDSSALQEKILRTLTGETGNWVRVGDPNQAIFETFTTASPDFLRNFLAEEDVVAHELPESGRSCRSIIALANHLIDWTMAEHPEEGVRTALSLPKIEPTPPGDSQTNPPDTPESIWIHPEGLTSSGEVSMVVQSVKRWVKDHPNETVAILVPRNERGFKFAEALRANDVECVELLRSTASTRKTAGVLGEVLNYLADPNSVKKLVKVFRVWRGQDHEDPEESVRLKRLARYLQHCDHVEEFLWPRFDGDWPTALGLNDLGSEGIFLEDDDDAVEDIHVLAGYREIVRRWQKAVLLPIDQLILTIAQDLFHEAVDLALAYKLALLLRDASDSNPEWGLTELAQEMTVIASNQRKFLGLSEDDTAFEPDKYPGVVVVATMHKAKGLEWDRVYLTSINNYDFPSAQSYDTYIAEKWFVRDFLNLSGECANQLDIALDGGTYEEGEATREARLDYVAERLRLLYVGITRARKQLIITWNKGANAAARQAVPLFALQAFWEEKRAKALGEEGEGEAVMREGEA